MMNETVKTKVVPINSIFIPERIRKDNGDIGELMASINERGLINPVTVMEQSENSYILIAGLRRLEACTRLGWSKLRTTVLSPMEAEEMLLLEIAENEQRKEFTVSERLDYAERIKVVEREKAKLRMSEYARDGRSNDDTSNQGVRNCPHPESKGKARDNVAKKAGFGSARQMERAAAVANERPDLMEKIDTGELTIFGAYQQTRPQKSNDDSPPTILKSDYAGVPTQSQEKTRRKMTQKQRDEIKNINEKLVTITKVELEPLQTVSPATLTPDGEPGTLAGATHDELMANSIYACMYKSYIEVVQAANTARGTLRFKCEGYEKQIRAYEERARSMAEENDKLRNELNKLKNAGGNN